MYLGVCERAPTGEGELPGEAVTEDCSSGEKMSMCLSWDSALLLRREFEL